MQLRRGRSRRSSGAGSAGSAGSGSRRCSSCGLPDRAGRRRLPERPVIGPAVVVARQPESEREDQHQDGRGERPPRADDPHVGGVHVLAGGVGAVPAPSCTRWRRTASRTGDRYRAPVVVGVLERGPGGVDDEGQQHGAGDERLEPPPVPAQGPLGDRRPSRPLAPGAPPSISPSLHPFCRLRADDRKITVGKILPKKKAQFTLMRIAVGYRGALHCRRCNCTSCAI